VPFTVEQTESSSILQLQGTVDIASAAELKQILTDELGPGKSLRVSLSNSTGLDVTAVQLLYAAHRAAKATGTDFAYQGQLPEQVVSALTQAGFENFPIPADPR
jgi:anti-anti-sigma regulatory factor